jgi:hypothetical protein
VLVVAAMVLLSMVMSWRPAERLWNTHVVESWPAVQGTITSGHVDFTHTPRIGKRSAWNAWCASWNYAYDWNGIRHEDRVSDLTPSTFAPGCFTYREGAEHAASRRAPGSTLAIHVDPQEPWRSSPYLVSVCSIDVFELILGVLPALTVLYLVLGALFGRRGVAPTPGPR